MDEEVRLRFEALEKRVENLEKRDIEPTTMGGTTTSKRLSMREFFNDFNPKNNIDSVLAIGYHKEIIQGVTPFTVKDIESGFSEAKEPAPDNVNLPILNNVQKGFFMESKNIESKLKSWELTNTGIEEVKKRLIANKKATLEADKGSAKSGGD